ncbi:MAG: ATP-dependent sacrificial sulfur transferase LarE [Chloroflexota bacterium]
MELNDKAEALRSQVAELGNVAVAFSGGSDSSLLLAVALRVLGPQQVLAVIADSPTLPRQELEDAKELAIEWGAQLAIVPTEEMADERFANNPPDRCYYCKRELFEKMRQVAAAQGFRHLAYGATAADLGDYRPGMKAAQEAGAVAPLLAAGFTKADVRAYSRLLGLPTWDKPAMACLSSRFPYGSRITPENLTRVEQAEQLLRYELGFREVRVRDHGDTARLEIVSTDFARLLDDPTRQQVLNELKALGYTYVTLDLAGFRSGSMNEALGNPSQTKGDT